MSDTPQSLVAQQQATISMTVESLLNAQGGKIDRLLEGLSRLETTVAVLTQSHAVVMSEAAELRRRQDRTDMALASMPDRDTLRLQQDRIDILATEQARRQGVSKGQAAVAGSLLTLLTGVSLIIAISHGVP